MNKVTLNLTGMLLASAFVLPTYALQGNIASADIKDTARTLNTQELTQAAKPTAGAHLADNGKHEGREERWEKHGAEGREERHHHDKDKREARHEKRKEMREEKREKRKEMREERREERHEDRH